MTENGRQKRDDALLLSLARGKNDPSTAEPVTLPPEANSDPFVFETPSGEPDVALLSIDPQNETVQQTIVAGLADGNSSAQYLIRGMGDKGAAVLAITVKQENPFVRAAAMKLLSELSNPSAAAPAYVAALTDDDTVRLNAALALQQIGGYSQQTIPILVKAFDQVDEDQRYDLEEALRHGGGWAAAALAAQPADTTAALELRLASLLALTSFYSPGYVEPQLRELLQPEESRVRDWAAAVLARNDVDFRTSQPLRQARTATTGSCESRPSRCLRLSTWSWTRPSPNRYRTSCSLPLLKTMKTRARTPLRRCMGSTSATPMAHG